MRKHVTLVNQLSPVPAHARSVYQNLENTRNSADSMSVFLRVKLFCFYLLVADAPCTREAICSRLFCVRSCRGSVSTCRHYSPHAGLVTLQEQGAKKHYRLLQAMKKILNLFILPPFINSAF